MRPTKLYLLDVEGTVAPISFVTETLVPYARKRLPDFLAENFDEPPVRGDLALLAEENRVEAEAGAPKIPTSCRRTADGLPAYVPTSLTYLLWLMGRDRKSTALKSLQGKIWKAGYERGELKSVLFEDVPEAFVRWSSEARVAIYSSGSAEAQVLFFRHSNHGDLTPMISGYFDTRTGPKQGSASYSAIAAEMNLAAEEVLFFSDVVGELDAAREAGCDTRLVMREGNAPVSDGCGHSAIESFRDL